MTQIVGAVYCEQKVVYDRILGALNLPNVAAMASKGVAAHRRFELEGYLHNPTTLLAKSAGRGGIGDRRCFIATHVYGTDATSTATLRQWRDRVLMPRRLGRLMVAVYYRLSPGLVRALRVSPTLTGWVRRGLDNVVARIERTR